MALDHKIPNHDGPLSMLLKDALSQADDLRQLADVSPFGVRAVVDRCLSRIETDLRSVLRAITETRTTDGTPH